MSDKEKLDEILVRTSEIKSEVDAINRGLYGDPKNKVPGLLDRQDIDERRISAIENNQKKFFAIVGGIVVVLEVAWNFIKHKFNI